VPLWYVYSPCWRTITGLGCLGGVLGGGGKLKPEVSVGGGGNKGDDSGNVAEGSGGGIPEGWSGMVKFMLVWELWWDERSRLRCLRLDWWCFFPMLL